MRSRTRFSTCVQEMWGSHSACMWLGVMMPIEPGISFAADRRLSVVEAIVAEDAGFGIIGSLDFGAAMDVVPWGW